MFPRPSTRHPEEILHVSSIQDGCPVFHFPSIRRARIASPLLLLVPYLREKMMCEGWTPKLGARLGCAIDLGVSDVSACGDVSSLASEFRY